MSATNFVFDFAQQYQLIVTPTVRKWGIWSTRQTEHQKTAKTVENPDLNPISKLCVALKQAANAKNPSQLVGSKLFQMTVDRRTHVFPS